MGKRPERKPIAAFFASILHIILVIIVLNVIVIYTKTRRETGDEVNITYIAIKSVKKVWIDVKEGWNYSENDSLKVKP